MGENMPENEIFKRVRKPKVFNNKNDITPKRCVRTT